MQDPSESMDDSAPEENGQSNTAVSPVADDPTPDLDGDSSEASAVLAEVLPGVVFAFGDVPEKLHQLPCLDRERGECGR